MLVAIKDIGKGPRKSGRLWLLQCDCGKLTKTTATRLTRGEKISCGCQTIGDRTRIHGLSKHPAHGVWSSMLNRCYRKKDRGYVNYGARGIEVCEAWRNSFMNFWNDMEPTYKKNLTLERRDNSSNYCFENCYWATRKQQNQNKRSNVYLQTPWGKLCLSEAARQSGLTRGTLRRRLELGWTVDKLFISVGAKL